MVNQNDTKVTIVVAEDDEEDQQLFLDRINLIPQAIEVIFVNDGDQLIKVIQNSPSPPPPHLIFLDINMPRKNGLECLSFIESKKAYINVPVFMLSTSDREADIEYSYNHGASLYINKDVFYSLKMPELNALITIFTQPRNQV